MGEELVRGEGVGPHHPPQATTASPQGGVLLAPGATRGWRVPRGVGIARSRVDRSDPTDRSNPSDFSRSGAWISGSPFIPRISPSSSPGCTRGYGNAALRAGDLGGPEFVANSRGPDQNSRILVTPSPILLQPSRGAGENSRDLVRPSRIFSAPSRGADQNPRGRSRNSGGRSRNSRGTGQNSRGLQQNSGDLRQIFRAWRPDSGGRITPPPPAHPHTRTPPAAPRPQKGSCGRGRSTPRSPASSSGPR